MSDDNKLVSHTSIYMFGDVLRYSVSLVMLPIYTRYLTPEDYGVVELLSMLIDFSAILFGARVGQSVFRFYCTADNQTDKNTVISSALFLDVILAQLSSHSCPNHSPWLSFRAISIRTSSPCWQ